MASFLISHLESPPFTSELPSWSVGQLPAHHSCETSFSHSSPGIGKSPEMFPRARRDTHGANTSQRMRKRKIWFPLFASSSPHLETEQIKTISNWDGTIWSPESHIVLQGSVAETTFHSWWKWTRLFPRVILGVITLRLINSFATCADNMKGVTGDLEHTQLQRQQSFLLPEVTEFFCQKALFMKVQAAGICCVLGILKFLAYSLL